MWDIVPILGHRDDSETGLDLLDRHQSWLQAEDPGSAPEAGLGVQSSDSSHPHGGSLPRNAGCSVLCSEVKYLEIPTLLTSEAVIRVFSEPQFQRSVAGELKIHY